MANEKPRLKIKYEKEVLPELQKSLGIKNKMAVPNLTKIIINSGLGEAKTDNTAIEEMVRDIALIAGQKPVITKSKKAISNFKIRKGMDIGVKVTLRKDMMWYFFDRLVSVALPRVKDFRGVPLNAFDGQGNYALGLKEHTIFPEVDGTKVSKLRGLQVIICTSADDNEKAKSLLSLLGMPFQKV